MPCRFSGSGVPGNPSKRILFGLFLFLYIIDVRLFRLGESEHFWRNDFFSLLANFNCNRIDFSVFHLGLIGSNRCDVVRQMMSN